MAAEVESVLRTFTNAKDTTAHPEILIEVGTQDFKQGLREAPKRGTSVLVRSLFGRDMATKYPMDFFDIIDTMKGDDVAVDYKEWSEVPEMVNMKPGLEGHEVKMIETTRKPPLKGY
jgi:hypothetical protein